MCDTDFSLNNFLNYYNFRIKLKFSEEPREIKYPSSFSSKNKLSRTHYFQVCSDPVSFSSEGAVDVHSFVSNFTDAVCCCLA